MYKIFFTAALPEQLQKAAKTRTQGHQVIALVHLSFPAEEDLFYLEPCGLESGTPAANTGVPSRNYLTGLQAAVI
jgi:hypothetical protein